MNEENYAVQAAGSLVENFYILVKLNLTSGSYYALKLAEDIKADGIMPRQGSWSDFTDIFCKYYLEAESAEDFRRCAESLFFDAGIYDGCHWMRVNHKIGTKNFVSILEFIAAEDYAPDNISLYMTVKDISREFINKYFLLERIFKAMGENYTSIYYIDFENDFVKPYRLSAAIKEAYGSFLEKGISYDKIINSPLSEVVKEKYRSRVLKVLQKENLMKRLSIEGSFSIDFPGKQKGKDIYIRLKAANLGEAGEPITKAVIGISDITIDKLEEQNFYKLGRSVLIIEDNELNREILGSILEDDYDIIMAENGIEALKVLEESYEDIAAVMTDLQMPVMNGYELIAKISEDNRFSSIPIIVTTASTSIEDEVKCLELGASDFVTKPYNANVVKNRVKSLVRLKESTAMLNTLAKDSLTGLYTKEFFYKFVADILNSNLRSSYQIVCSDIENFKMVNDKYGTKVGDSVLAYVSARLKDFIPGYIIGGYISGDIFAVLRECVPFENTKEKLKIIKEHAPVPNLNIKFGICAVDRTLSVQGLCDRALLAIENIKGQYDIAFAEYDDMMRQDIAKQQQILDNMESALENHQFYIYYQPKHDLKKNLTGGAEALVRWIHPDLGFMNPGLFISLFEQNGFITKLDKYICEEVCRSIHEWKAAGKKVVPISINVSRRDFEEQDLAEFIIGMADKYEISHDLLHIEVTESAYSDNPRIIVETVKKLHESGFVIELDDFGAGYSSLSTLSSMHIDVMKLDMSLIKNDKPGTKKNVLEFAMHLAQMINMQTVAEGVENNTQKERLESLGCDYIQGYYYSKPLPKAQFEDYLEANA